MKLRALVRDLLCLLLLLHIPVHFASQAQNELLDCSSIVFLEDESKDEETISPIPVPSPTYDALWRRARGNNDVVSSPHAPQHIQKSITLKSGWTICVCDWCQLWRNITNACFTILTGFSVLLQMPGTSRDPLARFFVFMSILRLVPALLSAVILLYHFSKKRFNSGSFAVIWYQNVERHRQSCLYMPWTILGLPAIALSWGAIFMLVAVFLSVWGDGLDPTLSSVGKISPLTIMSFRVVISAMSVLDVGWVSWLVVKLQAFDKAIKAAQAPAGYTQSHFPHPNFHYTRL